jgi:hypothetical protein
MELFFGVENFEGEDGEAVDDEAGGFGVEGCGGVFGRECEEGDVDLLGEVVAKLVEAIDLMLAMDDGGVGGLGVTRFVFAVPEIEVGTMLIEDELVEGRCGDGRGGCGVVTVDGELVLEHDDVVGVEHAGGDVRITEAGHGR